MLPHWLHRDFHSLSLRVILTAAHLHKRSERMSVQEYVIAQAKEVAAEGAPEWVHLQPGASVSLQGMVKVAYHG